METRVLYLQHPRSSSVSLKEQEFWKTHLHNDADSAPIPTDPPPPGLANGHLMEPHEIAPESHPLGISPIHTLPEELLINIFRTHSALPQQRAPKDDNFNWVALIQLSHVCCTWRYIVSCCIPTIWSVITLLAPRTMGIVRLVELCLIRTGSDCPLNLTLRQDTQNPPEVRAVGAILKVFLSYIHRWHTISIRLLMSSPEPFLSLSTPRNLVSVGRMSLRELDRNTQDTIWDAINGSKGLRRVTWTLFIPQSTPWSQLEDIRTTVSDINPLTQNLSQLVRLNKLSVHSKMPHQESTVGSLLSILPNLQFLEVRGHFSVSLAVLDPLVTPSLNELRIEVPQHPQADDVLAAMSRLLTRSNCQLVTLNILSKLDDRLAIPNFLRQTGDHLNALRALELEGAISDELAMLLTLETAAHGPHQLSSSAARIYLPALEVFKSNWKPIVDGVLGAMIQSRYHKGRLRTADISLRMCTALHFPDKDVSILELLQREGEDVRWKWLTR